MTKANEYELQEGDTIRDWLNGKEVIWEVLGHLARDGVRLTRLLRQDTETASALNCFQLAKVFETNRLFENGRS